MSEQVGFVTGVHFFPIKSCHEATVDGQLPSSLTVGPTGFEHGGAADRRWVIVDPSDLFVSQRGWDKNKARKNAADRKLATVKVDVRSDHLAVSADGQELAVPFDTESTAEASVQIFGPKLDVIDEGPEAAEFFSDFLGRAVRLTKANRHKPRILPEIYQRPDAANQSAAADGRPFSIGSYASLDYLHDLAGLKRGTVRLNRYRTNIDIGGPELRPFLEDEVLIWRIGARAIYHEVKAMSRCPVPNVDQKTGSEEGKLSNKLLIPHRLGWSAHENLDLNTKAEPFFAQSLNHALVSIGEVISGGDPVYVNEWRNSSNFIPKKY